MKYRRSVNRELMVGMGKRKRAVYIVIYSKGQMIHGAFVNSFGIIIPSLFICLQTYSLHLVLM